MTRSQEQNRRMKPMPSQAYLAECFEYYSDGALVWLNRPAEHFRNSRACNIWNAKFANVRAGRLGLHGYRQVGLDGLRYLEHRLIAAFFGLDCSGEIDHIDGNSNNNRIENLRAANRFQNNRNHRTSKANTSGHMGVYALRSGRWKAGIRRDGRQVWLGAFDNFESAVSARLDAEREVYGAFSPRHSGSTR